MLGYLLSILGLAALCGCWVLFQRWLECQAPGETGNSLGCSGCGGTRCKKKREEGA